MTDAVVKHKKLCGSINGFYFVTYELSNVATENSDLFRLPLYSIKLSQSYLHPQESSLDGNAYGIDIKQYTISNLSEDFDLKILNVPDDTKEDTVNNIYQSTNVNKYETNNDLNLLYLNKEDSLDSYLYLLLNNNDTSNATGVTYIELVYRVIKTKNDGTSV